MFYCIEKHGSAILTRGDGVNTTTDEFNLKIPPVIDHRGKLETTGRIFTTDGERVKFTLSHRKLPGHFISLRHVSDNRDTVNFWEAPYLPLTFHTAKSTSWWGKVCSKLINYYIR